MCETHQASFCTLSFEKFFYYIKLLVDSRYLSTQTHLFEEQYFINAERFNEIEK